MKKYKIVKERPFVFDEQIDALKHFDKLMNMAGEARESAKTSGRQAIKRMVVAGGVIVVILIGLNWLWQRPAETDGISMSDTKNSSGQWIAQDKAEQLTSPVDSAAREEVVERPQTQFSKQPEKETPAAATVPEKEKDAADSAILPEYIYQEPVPVDGLEALYSYFETELRYPETARADSVSGVTLVTFVIDTAGKPVQIEIVKSLGPPFDAEAIRVIENMPDWNPATINGNPVRSKVNIPLTFQIKSE